MSAVLERAPEGLAPIQSPGVWAAAWQVRIQPAASSSALSAFD